MKPSGKKPAVVEPIVFTRGGMSLIQPDVIMDSQPLPLSMLIPRKMTMGALTLLEMFSNGRVRSGARSASPRTLNIFIPGQRMGAMTLMPIRRFGESYEEVHSKRNQNYCVAASAVGRLRAISDY